MIFNRENTIPATYSMQELTNSDLYIFLKGIDALRNQILSFPTDDSMEVLRHAEEISKSILTKVTIK